MGEATKEAPPAEEKKEEQQPPAEPEAAPPAEEQPPPPPPPFVLYVDLHCAGCAKKISRSIMKLRGVENVVIDMGSNQVTVKGVVDAEAVCKMIKKKGKRMATVISPLPAAEGDPMPQVIASQVSGLVTVELNVNMHCEACADQLKKKILQMRGVQSAETDFSSGKVVVTGTMDADKLVEYVYRRTKKQARIVPQPEPENPPEEPKPAEEAKESEKPAEEPKPEEEKKEEENPKEEKDNGALGPPVEAEEGKAVFSPEEESMKRMMYYYQAGSNASFYQPMYAIERVPPPQLFSDENPNACCIS